MKFFFSLLFLSFVYNASAYSPAVLYKYKVDSQDNLNFMNDAKISQDQKTLFLLTTQLIPSFSTSSNYFSNLKYDQHDMSSGTVTKMFHSLDIRQSLKGTSTAISSTGQKVMIGDHDGREELLLYQLASNRLTYQRRISLGSDFRFSQAGDLLILDADDSGRFIPKFNQSEKNLEIPRENYWHGRLRHPAISDNGKLSVFEQGGRHIYLFENESGKLLDQIDYNFDRIWNDQLLKFAGDHFILSIERSLITVYEVQKNKLVSIAQITPMDLRHDGFFLQADLSADGRRLVYALSDRKSGVYDFKSKRVVREWNLALDHEFSSLTVPDLKIVLSEGDETLFIQSKNFVEVLNTKGLVKNNL